MTTPAIRVQIHLPYRSEEERVAAVNFIEYIKMPTVINNLPIVDGYTLTPRGRSRFQGEWLNGVKWMPDDIVILMTDIKKVDDDDSARLEALVALLQRKASLFYHDAKAYQKVIYATVNHLSRGSMEDSSIYLFKIGDLVDPNSLVRELVEPSLRMSHFIKSKIPPEFIAAIETRLIPGSFPITFRVPLIDHINVILVKEAFHCEEWAKELELSQRTLELIARKKHDEHHLKRCYFEDAYPGCFEPYKEDGG